MAVLIYRLVILTEVGMRQVYVIHNRMVFSVSIDRLAFS